MAISPKATFSQKKQLSTLLDARGDHESNTSEVNMYRRNPNLLPNRIFVDASYTLFSGKNSGIERVVRSLIREYNVDETSNAVEREIASRIQMVFSHRGQFYHLDEPTRVAFQQASRLYGDILGHLPDWYRMGATHVCRGVPIPSVRRWLLPEAGHLGLFKVPMTFHRFLVKQNRRRTLQPLRTDGSDVLLLPDAYWTCMDVWRAAAKARRTGATVATLIYDLIPITHPNVVGQKRSIEFAEYLRQASTHSDVMIAISKTVQEELIEYHRQQLADEPNVCPDVRSFALGAELKTSGDDPRASVRSIFRPGATDNPYLMVATFDPRKNHSYILDAFDALWGREESVKLCLVGRVGWSCKDVLERIATHPQLGKKLFVVHDASDGDLQHCYRNARAVISPSIVEGFGLPIVESLWYGCETIVSDTPIHREVGGDRCQYFDLNSPESLSYMIREFERNRSSRPLQSFPKFEITTWRQSAQFLMQHCLDAYAQKTLGAYPAPQKMAA